MDPKVENTDDLPPVVSAASAPWPAVVFSTHHGAFSLNRVPGDGLDVEDAEAVAVKAKAALDSGTGVYALPAGYALHRM